MKVSGNRTSWIWVTLEEFLEMLGITVLLHALLAVIKVSYQEVQLTLMFSSSSADGDSPE
jgi:hypothetical protein